jgi:hypothetical protein
MNLRNIPIEQRNESDRFSFAQQIVVDHNKSLNDIH